MKLPNTWRNRWRRLSKVLQHTGREINLQRQESVRKMKAPHPQRPETFHRKGTKGQDGKWRCHPPNSRPQHPGENWVIPWQVYNWTIWLRGPDTQPSTLSLQGEPPRGALWTEMSTNILGDAVTLLLSNPRPSPSQSEAVYTQKQPISKPLCSLEKYTTSFSYLSWASEVRTMAASSKHPKVAVRLRISPFYSSGYESRLLVLF